VGQKRGLAEGECRRLTIGIYFAGGMDNQIGAKWPEHSKIPTKLTPAVRGHWKGMNTFTGNFIYKVDLKRCVFSINQMEQSPMR
jgi:hypothetical protein